MFCNMFSFRCRKTFSLILILSFIFLFPGCQKEQIHNPLATSAAKSFDRYTERFFKEQMLGSGLNLHFLFKDTSEYSDARMTLGEYSYESMQAVQPFYIEQIEQLRRIDYNALDPQRKLTYEVLLRSFKNQLDFSDFCLLAEDLSPTLGIQSQLPVILSEYDFLNKSDVDNYLALLSTTYDYFQGICDFQILKAEKNCFIGSATCDAIISQCTDFLNSKNLETNLLYTSFCSKIEGCAGLSDIEKKTYTEKNKTLIADVVFPAYELLIETLSSLKNQGACKNEKGLAHFKQGKDYYEYLVRNETGSTLTVPEIKAMIQTQVIYDIKQLYSLYTTSPELETALSQAQTTLNPEQILQDLIEKSRDDFSEILNLQYTIKTVDEQLQDYLSPAFYISPPLDDLNQNIIYINPQKTTGDLYTTLAHEGIPGHLYQNAYFSSTNPDKIRYLVGCGGYSEGWAVYAEILSYHYLYDNENLATALGCNMSYSLALYCLCDIGVNYEGWDFETLKAFLEKYEVKDEDACRSMFQAVIEDPANYLKYYVGYLEILKLKNYVMEQTNADFNLKKFHDAFLAIGPTDFDVVKNWIMYMYNQSE